MVFSTSRLIFTNVTIIRPDCQSTSRRVRHARNSSIFLINTKWPLITTVTRLLRKPHKIQDHAARFHVTVTAFCATEHQLLSVRYDPNWVLWWPTSPANYNHGFYKRNPAWGSWCRSYWWDALWTCFWMRFVWKLSTLAWSSDYLDAFSGLIHKICRSTLRNSAYYLAPHLACTSYWDQLPLRTRILLQCHNPSCSPSMPWL